MEFSDSWRWRHFGPEQGAPPGPVQQLVHAPGGQVWIRTSGGVAWYDGYRFRIAGKENGAPARAAYLAAGPDGSVWLVGPDGLYAGGSKGFRAMPGRPPGRISEVAVRRNGEAVVLISGRLYTWKDGSYEPVEDGQTAPGWPPFLRPKRDGGIVWSGRRGLMRWGEAPSVEILAWPGIRYHAVAEAESGEGLAAVVLPPDKHGIWEWDSKGFRRAEPEGREQVRAVDIGPDGTAIAVYESGAVRVRERGVWREASAAPRELTEANLAVFDAAGDLWTATPSGTYLFRATARLWERYRHPFPDDFNTVNSLAAGPGGALWLGTPAGIELVRPGGATERMTEAAGTRLRVVTGLDMDREGALWATSGASFKGVLRFDGKRWRAFGPPDGVPHANVHNVETGPDGWPVFVITGHGPGDSKQARCVLRWNGSAMERFETDQSVYSAAVDASGVMWFGGDGGIERRDKAGRSQWWRRGGELRAAAIRKVLVARGGVVWFGDRSGDVGAIDRSGRAGYKGKLEEDLRDGVMDLAEDATGAIWATSSRGLYRFQGSGWKRFDRDAGLVHPYLWPLAIRDNRLCVGGIGGGASCMDLGSAFRRPSVTLDFRAAGDSGAEASWSVASFRGELPAAMIDTRHRIDGGPWSEWSIARKASLARASRGEHRIRVEARVPNGAVAGEEARVSLEGRWFEQPRVYGPAAGLLLAVALLFGTLLRRRDRHAAELAARDARFRGMIENGNDGIVLLGRDGGVRYASPSTLRILGTMSPALATAPIHPDDRPGVERCFGELVASPGQRRSGRVRMVQPDGSTCWIEVELSNQLDEPAVGAIVANFRDITASVKAMAELAAAKDRSEEASRAKSDFLATMSHEIRTPMNGIMGMTSLLLESPLGREQREFAASIQSSGTALLSILNDLLDLSRIEAGKVEVLREPFDLPHLLSMCVDFWRPGAADKGLYLVFVDEAKTDRWVRGDPGRLRQVVLNLLSNAVKFTRQGRVTLRCFSRIAEDGKIRFDVEVEDTGEGIPAGKLEAIFDKFTQADSSAARTHGGSGLGLTISRDLIRLMGGDMTVASRQGSGSRFRFHVTLEPAPAETPAAAPAETPRGAPLEVLVVEDNRINQRLVQRVIEKRGGHAVVAGNGEAAVELFKRNRFDAILMDCQMPVMDGFEATRRIREIEGGRSRTAIIALTANAMRGDREKCLAAGMDAFVAKPFEAAQLIRLLELARSGELFDRERRYSSPNT